MKILISGFEKFDGHAINPTEEVMKRISSPHPDIELKAVILPVSFKESYLTLEKEIELFQPDVIIGTGLAASRDEVTIERVAINLLEARIPDNDGYQPLDEKIEGEGEDGLFSQLPLKAMIKAAIDEGCRASISNSAGTYVCNYLMYKIVSAAKKNNLKGGFIHVPPVFEMNNDSSRMRIDQLVTVIQKMLGTLLEDKKVILNSGCED